MKLTSLEIKQQKFEKSLRGFDPPEVQAFLNLMANEWEHLVGKNRELERQIDDMQEKLEHYERVEEALHETLEAAKETAETKLVGARKEADNTIDKAEMQAEKITREAKMERQEVRQSIFRLLNRRKEIIGVIRSYLKVAGESLDRFDLDDEKFFSPPENPRPLKDEVEDTPNDEVANEANDDEEEPDAKTAGKPAAPPPEAQNIDGLVDELT